MAGPSNRSPIAITDSGAGFEPLCDALRLRVVAGDHVGRQAVVAVVGEVDGLLQRGQHLARAGEAAHGELLARERLLQHEADGLVVVNDPDGFHAWACPG